eukprot:COSAG01_NODE_8655_length_2706_cov_12.197929_4_plen_50_part_00
MKVHTSKPLGALLQLTIDDGVDGTVAKQFFQKVRCAQCGGRLASQLASS